MGYYEAAWEERKAFLFTSMIIGAVLALLLTVFLGCNLPEGYSFIENVFGLVVVAVVSFVMFSALVAVGRLVFTKSSVGGNFVTNFVHGVWVTIINIFTGGWFGLVIGLLLCFVFFWLFMIVAIGYAIYLPVSSIYLYVMYKKETAQEG